MRSFFIIALISLALLSCINWKAKYYEGQIELQKCQQAPPDTVIVIEPGSIVYEPGGEIVVGEDTLTVPEAQQPAINFVKTYVYKTEKDSVKLWLLVTNTLSGYELKQTIKIQRVDYPREIRTITKTVPVEKLVKQKVNPNVKMVVIGIIVLIGGLLVLKIINLVTK